MKAPGAPPYVVAVDVPTGLSADTGGLLPAAVCADLTVTFHCAKPGHYLNRGPEFCGALRVADIGIGPGDGDRAGPAGRGVSRAPSGPVPDAPARLIDAIQAPDKHAHSDAHKFSHGHALVLSGDAGRTGAARLAARGALRIGAGLVTLGAPEAAMAECAAQITAVMLRCVGDAEALAALLADGCITALCLGPGLGLTRARDLVPEALGRSGGAARAGLAVVLDADALTTFAPDPEALFTRLHPRCVLTPHGGEFARLFPDIAARLNAPSGAGRALSKIDATRAAARRAGCTVLFKGPDTVIAAPDGRASVHAAAYGRAAPWLATAGAGDVLAGFITGLLARGADPMQAAETAAWLHVASARAFGPGLIAEDLPEMLPQVLRALARQAAAASGGAIPISSPSA